VAIQNEMPRYLGMEIILTSLECLERTGHRQTRPDRLYNDLFWSYHVVVYLLSVHQTWQHVVMV